MGKPRVGELDKTYFFPLTCLEADYPHSARTIRREQFVVSTRAGCQRTYFDLENREVHQTIPDHRVKLTPEGQKQVSIVVVYF